MIKMNKKVDKLGYFNNGNKEADIRSNLDNDQSTKIAPESDRSTKKTKKGIKG